MRNQYEFGRAQFRIGFISGFFAAIALILLITFVVLVVLLSHLVH